MGYTKVPNQLFEKFMNNSLTNADRKIFAVVIRKIFGFHKEGDYISYSQFEDITGLSRQSVNSSLTRLVKQGLLRVRRGNRKTPNYWQITKTYIDTLPSNSELTSQPPVITPSRHTKEIEQNNLKNTRQGNISSSEISSEECTAIFNELSKASEIDRTKYGRTKN
ncbi:replication protein [Patescibacteria group bacterium]